MQNLTTHPNTAANGSAPKTGSDISSRNAIKHGACATGTLILPTESLDDYLALESLWFQGYAITPQNPGTRFEAELIRKAVRAEWFYLRAESNHAAAEAKIMTAQPDVLEWTNEHHQTLQRFLRYKTASANILAKETKAVEDYRKNRGADEARFMTRRNQDEQLNMARVRLDIYREKNKPELTWEEHLEGMRQQAVKLGFVRTPEPPEGE